MNCPDCRFSSRLLHFDSYDKWKKTINLSLSVPTEYLTDKWWKRAWRKAAEGFVQSYINIHFVTVVCTTMCFYFVDDHVDFVHFVPILTLPVSIASEHPYTMTLEPQSHQRQFLLVLTWVGGRHVTMPSLEKSWKACFFFFRARTCALPASHDLVCI